MSRGRSAGVALAFAMLAASHVAAAPLGSETAREAVALCRRAAALAPDDAVRVLDRGTALADAAVAADPGDAVAQFAAFCTRARRLEHDGLGFPVLSELSRLRRALDTAIALAPDWADALAAKGALLLRLPRLLGGDPREGTRLLERAAALAPDNVAVRALLADGGADRVVGK